MNNILGIDLNAYRGNLNDADFDKLHEAGCRFIGLRVSVGGEGDATAGPYVEMARARGWVTFGYHYLKSYEGDNNAQNGYEQGQLYAARAEMFDLDGHFLDVEDSGLKWNEVVHAAEAMRAGLHSALGLYSRRSFYEPKFGKMPPIFDFEWWADYRDAGPQGVWLAQWEAWASATHDHRPGPLWQFTDELKWKRTDTDGKRSVDGNVYEGTQVALLRYLQGRV